MHIGRTLKKLVRRNTIAKMIRVIAARPANVLLRMRNPTTGAKIVRMVRSTPPLFLILSYPKDCVGRVALLLR